MKGFMSGLPLLVWVVVPGQALFAQDNVQETLDTEHQTLQLVRIVDGLEHPLSVAIIPNDGYLVTERSGRLQRVEQGRTIEVAGVPEVHAQIQGGLLEVVPHPDYDENRWLYFAYSQGDSDATATALGRARLGGEALVEHQELFEQNRRSHPSRHYGSELAWLPDGSLLMTIGDRGEPERAQDTSDHAGSILRLGEDGLALEGNPYFEEVGYLPALYSWGHRMIRGIAVDPQDGTVWATEPSPHEGGELNRIQAGNNYGWPEVIQGRPNGNDEPVMDAVESALFNDDIVAPAHTFAPPAVPSGLALVTSDHYPHWQGNLIVGDATSGNAYRLTVEGSDVAQAETLSLDQVEGIRDIQQGPDGYLYVLSNGENGALYRLEPADESR
ncbi:PQQ-dependent sugar dehydrogenase [Halomonas korlensis]|uniref:Glucose/arabinose dehydrogenase, beta-propeller fold n=1 Tax=Halomonas korlensis TaxID=463301 RepID=A0A1I7I4I9_9GAMM|nr:PQQ-dependent sugar dehydrogenase [Halomonas korlensis]SFU67869.1 Glucose/arabinose dehydrogenase, beta-propeller fold [Halomonas korlensis]